MNMTFITSSKVKKYIHEGCHSKPRTFVITRDCVPGILRKFTCRLHLHPCNIMYKYGLNRSLDNKVMNLYVTACQRLRHTSHAFLLYFSRGVVKCFVLTLFI